MTIMTSVGARGVLVHAEQLLAEELSPLKHLGHAVLGVHTLALL